MEEHRVVITSHESNINTYLKDGWLVVSVTPQIVSTGGHSHLESNFCFVIKKIR